MGWGVLVSYDFTPVDQGDVDWYYMTFYCNTGDRGFGPLMSIPYPRTDGQYVDAKHIKQQFYPAWEAACEEVYGEHKDARSLTKRMLERTAWLAFVHAGWREREEYEEIFGEEVSA